MAAAIRARVQTEAVSAELAVRNLSRGGAFLETAQPLGDVGTRLQVTLLLPEDGAPVTLEARIVRRLPPPERGGGVGGVGIRFTSLDPEQSLQLLSLLDRALGRAGAERRAHPRISHLLEVRCHSRGELKALLRDISHGGAGLWVDTALARGEPVAVDIPRPDGARLQLEGTVVACEPLEDERGGFRAGLHFERLPPAARRALHAFLRGLYHP